MATELLQCRSNSNGKCLTNSLTVELGTWQNFTGLATCKELPAGEETLASWMRRRSSQPRRLRTASNQAHLPLGIAVWRSALLSAVIMFNGQHDFPSRMVSFKIAESFCRVAQRVTPI